MRLLNAQIFFAFCLLGTKFGFASSSLSEQLKESLTEFTHSLLDKCALLRPENQKSAQKRELKRALSEMVNHGDDASTTTAYLGKLAAMGAFISGDLQPRVALKTDPYNRQIKKLNGRGKHSYGSLESYFDEVFPLMRKMLKENWEKDASKSEMFAFLRQNAHFEVAFDKYLDAMALAYLGQNAHLVTRQMFNVKYWLDMSDYWGGNEHQYLQHAPDSEIRMPSINELDMILKQEKIDANKAKIEELKEDSKDAVKDIGKAACCCVGMSDRIVPGCTPICGLGACLTGFAPNLIGGGIASVRALSKKVLNGHKASTLQKENAELEAKKRELARKY